MSNKRVYINAYTKTSTNFWSIKIPECIDLQIEVQPVDFDQMSSKQAGEPSSAIRARVVAAREIQAERFKNIKGVYCNVQMTTALLHKYAEPDIEGMEKLREAITKMNMSARAYDRILKVARTIADLEANHQLSYNQHSEGE